MPSRIVYSLLRCNCQPVAVTFSQDRHYSCVRVCVSVIRIRLPSTDAVVSCSTLYQSVYDSSSSSYLFLSRSHFTHIPLSNPPSSGVPNSPGASIYAVRIAEPNSAISSPGNGHRTRRHARNSERKAARYSAASDRSCGVVPRGALGASLYAKRKSRKLRRHFVITRCMRGATIGDRARTALRLIDSSLTRYDRRPFHYATHRPR